MLRTPIRHFCKLLQPRIQLTNATSAKSAFAPSAAMSSFINDLAEKVSASKSLKYSVRDRVAHIMLDRPERLNAIDIQMPGELMNAVEMANLDDSVKVILLYGNGRAFCAGYDLLDFAEAAARGTIGSQEMPWDPYVDWKFMNRCNQAWMSLWRSDKPTVVKVHGVAVGGGSDMALCCDLTYMAEDARIGYPPSRVWGCPTTAMWAYRVGAERAKRIHFSGELVRGTDAAAMGLVGEAVPAAELDAVVDKAIARIATVPTNQLFFHKQVVNSAIEQMGLFNTQRLATLFDGMSRHSPEGVAFQQRTMEVGFKQAVKERDSGEETEWSNMLDKNKSKL